MAWPAVKPYKGVPPQPKGPGPMAGLSKALRGPLKVPAGMPKFPIPANQNFAVAARLGPRVLARAVPYLGTALIVYELIKFATQLNTSNWNSIGCGSGAEERYLTGGGLSCSGASGIMSGVNPWPSFPPPARYTGSSFKSYDILGLVPGTSNRYAQHIRAYARISSLAPASFEQWVPIPRPGAAISPSAQPIMRPQGVPRPKTWPEAVAPPGTQPSANPKPQPNPKPNPAKNPRPESKPLPVMPWPVAFVPPSIPRPDGTPQPLQPPNVVITVPGSPSIPGVRPVAPGVGVTPGTGVINRPPGPGVKETKVQIKTVVGAAGMAVLGIPGEVLDFVGAMWEALPDTAKSKVYYKGKKKDPSQATKMKDLYDHLGEMNVAAFVAAYINNQAEDAFYAKLGKAGAKGNEMTGMATGADKAINSGSKIDDPDAYKGSIVPQLSYDPATGKWGIKWLEWST